MSVEDLRTAFWRGVALGLTVALLIVYVTLVVMPLFLSAVRGGVGA